MAFPDARPRVAAVLTAYHPDARLTAVVESALKSCELVVVADNTPSGSAGAAGELSGPRVKVLSIGRNLGLGGALNLAVAQLPADFDGVLFLDQDSVLPEGLVEGLAVSLGDPTIGIVAPAPWDFKHDTYYCATANACATISDEEAVITSGMLVRRGILDAVRFREDLFIDWVDIAFCLDVGRTGARIVLDWRLRLLHSIGACERHSFFFRAVHVSHYPAWRLYWIGRNAPLVHRMRFKSRSRAYLSTALFAGPRLVTTIVFESPRRGHVSALVRGLVDGLRGRVDLAFLPEGAHYPTK